MLRTGVTRFAYGTDGVEIFVQIEAAFAQLVEEPPDAVILLDEGWRLVYANRRAREVSNLVPAQMNGPTLWEMYPQIVDTPLGRMYEEAMSGRVERRAAPYFYEASQKWLDIRLIPVGSGLAVYYQDVTEMHAAETARDGYARKLQQALEATSDAVVGLDRAWNISYLNGRAKAMLAASCPVVGANVWELFPAAVEQNLPFVEHYYRAMDEGVGSEFDSYYHEPLNRWISVMTRPTDDGIIVFSRDVTEQKRTAAALIQSEKLAAVGRLASTISHEINNPLEAVTNLLYLIGEDLGAPEAARYLKMAEMEVRRVTTIATETLRFHRPSSRPTTVTCLDLFTSVLAVYDGRLKILRIRVEKRKRAGMPVTCLEGQIRQVLNNLVDNAIEAGPGRLLVRSREGTDWRTGRRGLVLTVADDGCGIDAETKQRMFEAFYTTKGENGNGLGLWISAGIVDGHEGRLRVRSSQDGTRHGTVVTLFLPFEPAAGLVAAGAQSKRLQARGTREPALVG